MRLEILDDQVDGPSTAVTPVLGLQGDPHGPKASQRQDTEVAPEVLYQGTLEALGVTHFLYRLATRRVTGRLTLDSPEVSKEVAFRGGCPVQVQSSAHQELFGELLVARNLIDRDTLERSVQAAQEESRPLGELLVSDGLIPSHRLLRLLEEQFRTRFLELFCWQEGTYVFYTGEPEATHTIWMGTDPYELIAEGVRSQLSVEVIEEAYAEQQDLPIVHRDNRHITHNNLRLSSRELRCYGVLANAGTLREALDACEPEERPALLQVAFLLEQTELLSFAQGNP